MKVVWMRVAVWTVVTVALASSTAFAGGPPELLTQVVVDPQDPNHMVLRYDNAGDGLLFTRDGGETWQALCTEGLRPESVDRISDLGRLGVAGDGTTFVGLFDNAVHDDGQGCAFVAEPIFDGAWVTDFTPDPTDPKILYAVTGTAPSGPNGVFRRGEDGSWEALGTHDETTYDRIHAVALPAGGLRLVASGAQGTLGVPPDSRPNYVVLVSDDLGVSWTTHVFDVGEAGVRMRLEAVDPQNPDRLVISLHRQTDGGPRGEVQDEVLVSADQGATFTAYAALTQFGGLDMAPDGRIWIGDLGDGFDVEAASGLYYAESLDGAPEKIEDTMVVSCVEHLPADDQVFLCSREHAGVAAADGTGFTRTYDFRTADAIVGCDDQDMVSVCRQQYTRFWCTAAHFNTAPLCCAYRDESGAIAGVVPEDLECPDDEPDPMDPGEPTEPGPGDPMEPPGTAGSGAPSPGDGDGDGDGDGEGEGDGGVGAGDDGGPDATPGADDTDGGGCGCRLADTPGGTGAPAGLLLAGLVGLRVWRRRRRVTQG